MICKAIVDAHLLYELDAKGNIKASLIFTVYADKKIVHIDECVAMERNLLYRMYSKLQVLYPSFTIQAYRNGKLKQYNKLSLGRHIHNY